VIETEETIFYPQGGGQPSDVGTFKSSDGNVSFDAIIVRNAPEKGRILHFGRFEKGDAGFKEGDEVSLLR
jgi:Ser-tRNA(Ala) deacylase AlaX